ncbi:hypothetical protein B0H19DRAFT_1386613 [Mycena capillaripes]|nr:hypothetical protein B0H19DRAFT_1386613 [Mycena capillaripes]
MSTTCSTNYSQTIGSPHDLCALVWNTTVHYAILDPALSGTFNPDVMGYGVRLSNFVINISAGILIRWGDAQDAHRACSSKFLNFFDGHFTLLVVHSPIAWYTLWINTREVYSWMRRWDKRIPANTVLCFVMLCGWAILHPLVWVKGRKFPASGVDCGSLSFKVYLVNVVMSSLPGASSFIQGDKLGATVSVFWVLIYVQYFLRYTIPPARRRHRKRFSLTRFIFKHHTWPIYLAVVYSYYQWSTNLSVWWVEPGYSFTYGQSLSLVAAAVSAAPVLPLLVSKLRKLRREDLHRMHIKFNSEFIFLWFGSGNLAVWINKQYFKNCLILPPHEFPPSEPSALPIARISSSPSIPLTRTYTSTASNSSIHLAARASSTAIALTTANPGAHVPSNSPPSTSPQTQPGHPPAASEPASTALTDMITINGPDAQEVDLADESITNLVSDEGVSSLMTSGADAASGSTSAIVQTRFQGDMRGQRRTRALRRRSTY